MPFFIGKKHALEEAFEEAKTAEIDPYILGLYKFLHDSSDIPINEEKLNPIHKDVENMEKRKMSEAKFANTQDAKPRPKSLGGLQFHHPDSMLNSQKLLYEDGFHSDQLGKGKVSKQQEDDLYQKPITAVIEEGFHSDLLGTGEVSKQQEEGVYKEPIMAVIFLTNANAIPRSGYVKNGIFERPL